MRKLRIAVGLDEMRLLCLFSNATIFRADSLILVSDLYLTHTDNYPDFNTNRPTEKSLSDKMIINRSYICSSLTQQFVSANDRHLTPNPNAKRPRSRWGSDRHICTNLALSGSPRIHNNWGFQVFHPSIFDCPAELIKQITSTVVNSITM